MLNTLKIYLELFSRKSAVENRFEGGYPVWKGFDAWADGIPTRVFWILFYTVFYLKFASAPWQFLLLPIHYFMGPIHGAIVNWCGHKYGYANFDNQDASRNTLPVDLLTVGELMQNNHHHFGSRPNFAVRKFEFDPTYLLIKILNKFKIITLPG